MQVECDKTCQTLPFAPESSGIILLKLKHNCSSEDTTIKLCTLKCWLTLCFNWLVANNKLYKTITIDIDKLDRNLTNLQNTSISECIINTTTQPVNGQNIIIADEIISEKMNEPENEGLVIK